MAFSPEDEDSAESLKDFISEFHRRSATWLNRETGNPGRKVWHNFWETHLSYERSHFARLNYVHRNAVRHGIVRRAADYPYCSARWLEERAVRSFFRTISSFRTDRIRVEDDF